MGDRKHLAENDSVELSICRVMIKLSHCPRNLGFLLDVGMSFKDWFRRLLSQLILTFA